MEAFQAVPLEYRRSFYEMKKPNTYIHTYVMVRYVKQLLGLFDTSSSLIQMV
jgi:hypothetical protein